MTHPCLDRKLYTGDIQIEKHGNFLIIWSCVETWLQKCTTSSIWCTQCAVRAKRYKQRQKQNQIQGIWRAPQVGLVWEQNHDIKSQKLTSKLYIRNVQILKIQVEINESKERIEKKR